MSNKKKPDWFPKDKAILNYNGHPIYTVHVPGDNEKELKELAAYYAEKELVVDSNITIVTTATPDLWENCPVRMQCEANNIPLYNGALNFVGEWTNPFKPFFIVEALKHVNTDYVLIVDGRDVVLTHDLDEELIEKFKALDVDMVFNGTPRSFPRFGEPIDVVVKRKGNHPFLNAGVVFGYRYAVRRLYEDTVTRLESPHFRNTGSEQKVLTDVLVGLVVAERLEYAVDSDSELFAVLHHDDNIIVNESDESLEKKLIYRW